MLAALATLFMSIIDDDMFKVDDPFRNNLKSLRFNTKYLFFYIIVFYRKLYLDKNFISLLLKVLWYLD